MNKFDTADYDEALLAQLLVSQKVMLKAKELGVTPDDFMSSAEAGIRTYRALAEAILRIGEAPVSKMRLKLECKQTFRDNAVEFDDDVEEYINQALQESPAEEITIKELPLFLEHRRLSKVQTANKADPVKMLQEMSKVAVSLSTATAATQAVSATPFDQIITTQHNFGILTGFSHIDAKLHGLAKEECGLLIGHSGSGKTATATAIARAAALAGHNVLYFSLEEPYQNIVQRWYAAQFDMSYTELHYGLQQGGGAGDGGITKSLLEDKFAALTPDEKTNLMRLQVIDARALAPLTTKTLEALVEQKAAEGFIPELIIVDQLDYIRPSKQLPKGAMPWQEFEASAFELDAFSQYKIAKAHTFALWVIHQGKGEMQWEFGYDSIAGFKGIVKPFDICLGVGRASRESQHVNIFSMKVRHTEHARMSYAVDFAKMRFTPQKWTPPPRSKGFSKASGNYDGKLVTPPS